MAVKIINIIQYFWKIIVAHTTAFFIAGLVNFLEIGIPYELFFQIWLQTPNQLFLPSSTFFSQLFRGVILALIFLPLQKTFFEEKYGLIKLGIVIIGLFFLTNIGSILGGFTDYQYPTRIGLFYNLFFMGAIVYVILFIGILSIFFKIPQRRFVIILSVI